MEKHVRLGVLTDCLECPLEDFIGIATHSTMATEGEARVLHSLYNDTVCTEDIMVFIEEYLECLIP